MRTLKCVKTLEGHEDNVRVLAVGETCMFSGSWDKTIRVWDLRTLECIKVLEGHTEAVLALAGGLGWLVLVAALACLASSGWELAGVGYTSRCWRDTQRWCWHWQVGALCVLVLVAGLAFTGSSGCRIASGYRIARPIPQHRHLDATRKVFWGGFQRVVAQQLM